MNLQAEIADTHGMDWIAFLSNPPDHFRTRNDAPSTGAREQELGEPPN